MSLSPSRPFILRPVATSLLMAAILLAGFVGYEQLPVSALPEVDYPIIQVLTFYPGAGPEEMASSVTAPLERQFGQMPGLKQMTSVSSGGGSVITWSRSIRRGRPRSNSFSSGSAATRMPPRRHSSTWCSTSSISTAAISGAFL